VSPANVYISANLLIAEYQLTSNGNELGKAELGPGVSLMVGKEWWVSPNWGLGLAAQLLGASLKDKGGGNAPLWSVGGLALVFSATYN
jgi:CxxC motif-containing protein (DUF1111 family)